MIDDDNPERSSAVKSILEFAPHVGIFVLAFSIIDVHLSKIISYVHPRCSAEGLDLKMPRELTRKLGQVRRAFGESDALAPWKKDMLSVISEIESMKPTRDLFSHGAIYTDTLHLEDQCFSKVNPSERDSELQVEEVLSISKKDMKDEAKRALGVAARMLTIVSEMIRADERK